MKKRRSDSRIEGLPANQREALERWLFEENVSYDAACSRLFNDFGVRLSRTSLAEWRQWRAQERMLERIAASARTANDVVAKFEENPAETFSALLNLIGQAAFRKQFESGEELSLETLKDIAELTQLGLAARHDSETLKIKQRDLELKERRVALLEKKAALADAAEGAWKDATLSDEEKRARLNQIFGIGN